MHRPVATIMSNEPFLRKATESRALSPIMALMPCFFGMSGVLSGLIKKTLYPTIQPFCGMIIALDSACCSSKPEQ
jgi:hypothetical protein